MHIAFVTETFPPEVNGVALTVARTLDRLRERGHRLQLLRPHQPGETPRCDADEWRTSGLPIPMYPDLRFGVALPGTLRRRFTRWRPDLVHVATPGPLAWAALSAAHALGIATSSDFRTNFHHYSGYYGVGLLAPVVLAVLRRFHNGTQRTFVPTRALQQELAAQGFRNLSVVGRGVDTRRFDPARRSAALRSAWGVPSQGVVLLHVGRLAAEKNVQLALRTFEHLRQRHDDVHMVVVGDGPQRQALQARHPGARFLGMQHGEQLAITYASADVFLFPSLSETFGNVTMEALASGLATVCFDRAAAAEHIKDLVSGMLVLPSDDAGFIHAANALIRHPDLRRQLGRGAVQVARSVPWDDVFSSLERALQDTIDAHAAPRPGAAAVA